jgi:hypothetical protein
MSGIQTAPNVTDRNRDHLQRHRLVATRNAAQYHIIAGTLPRLGARSQNGSAGTTSTDRIKRSGIGAQTSGGLNNARRWLDVEGALHSFAEYSSISHLTRASQRLGDSLFVSFAVAAGQVAQTSCWVAVKKPK